MAERNDLGVSEPLATPLYQSSVYTLPDLDALDRIYNSEAAGYIYARDAHPNGRRLAAMLTALEAGKWGVVTGSGMGAISGILIPLLQQGGRIVAGNRLYGRTTQLLGQELPRFGVTTTYVDVNDFDAVRKALEQPARVLFAETMSNPLLRVPDLPRLAELAHERGCVFVVDNTFATPLLVKPLELGADFVMESLTKIIGGHSDITLGVACGRDEYQAEVTQAVSIWGLQANPFDCWLAERGLATLPLRLRAASANAAALAEWLPAQPGVVRVVYPGRSDHPDHAIARRLLGGVYGHMLCFELAGGRDAVNGFMRRAPGVPFSPSLGHTSTTCSHPATTSHRYMAPAEKARQGITDGLIRLSVGCEELDGIKAEMARGLGV
jgi:cystathionine beta-lyase/cystathionine gamma-synthase